LFKWDKEKNKILKKQRGICFEDIIEAMDDGILDVYDHPNQKKYPGQKIYVVATLGYVYLVPFITEGDDKFLKTIIPSRKAKKIYENKG
jgi:uncharacterized DUF497 family protein